MAEKFPYSTIHNNKLLGDKHENPVFLLEDVVIGARSVKSPTGFIDAPSGHNPP